MCEKYTKQEITAMADRCFHRCWHCNRYEPCGGTGNTGPYLFGYASGGCYEAHDLPWEHGHWCPFWGNKHHPDASILRGLTWDNVAQFEAPRQIYEPYDLRNKILNANPHIAQMVQYCDNSNESRDQYFNKSENHALFHFDKFDVYCETLRRYRFSYVDSRTLYPGANEWLRPMMLCFDRTTYRVLASRVDGGDGIQISFACSPDKNYRINSNIFLFDVTKKEILAEFKNINDIIATYRMPIGHIM